MREQNRDDLNLKKIFELTDQLGNPAELKYFLSSRQAKQLFGDKELPNCVVILPDAVSDLPDDEVR